MSDTIYTNQESSVITTIDETNVITTTDIVNNVTVTIPAVTQGNVIISTSGSATDLVGIPVGGTAGQILAKKSNTDKDVEWITKNGDMQKSLYDPNNIGLNVYSVDNHIDGTNNKVFTSTEKTKLASVEEGAEKNVQADWLSVSGDDYIKNKPTIPSQLSELTDDVNHRHVSDTEKNTWNGKQDQLAYVPENPDNRRTSFQVTPDDAHYVSEKLVKDSLDNKVDKEGGKSLSTNDFTNTLKTKLDGIQIGAEQNVNADWNATSGDAQILNKPAIPINLSDMFEDSGHRVVSDTEKSTWNGKQDALGYTPVPQTRMVNGKQLNGDITITANDISTLTIGNPTSVNNLRKYANAAWSTGIVYGADITDNGDGSISIASGEAMIRLSANENENIANAVFPALLNDFPANNTTTYYFVAYNSGSPIIQSSTIYSSINNLNSVHLCTVSKQDSYLAILDARQQSVDSIRKNIVKSHETSTFTHIIGGSNLGSNNRNVYVSAGGFYYGNNKILHSIYDTSVVGTENDHVFSTQYRNGSGEWTLTSDQKQINNTQYDNNSGTLATLTDNHYGVHWVYLILGSIPKLMIVYGTSSYSSLADAKSATIPSVLPQIILSTGVLLGRCIIQKNAPAIAYTDSAFSVNFVPSSATPLQVAGSNGLIQFNDNGTLGADDDFTWDSTAQSVNIGKAIILPDNPLAISGDVNTYLQVNIQNKSTGDAASADLIITANDGNDTEKYADIGFGNSNYTSTVWDVVKAHDMYLFVDGGDLVMGSLSVNKKVSIFVAETEHEGHPSDIIAEFDKTGLNILKGSVKEKGLSLKTFSIAMSIALG